MCVLQRDRRESEEGRAYQINIGCLSQMDDFYDKNLYLYPCSLKEDIQRLVGGALKD